MYTLLSLSERRFENILIIKPSSLGDVVRCVPIFNGLRSGWPTARISWLIRPDCAAILKNLDGLDRIIEFDRRHYGKMTRSIGSAVDFFNFLRSLHRERFDLVVDLQGLLRSGFISFCTGSSSRLGPADARELAGLFYSHRIGQTKGLHAVDNYWRFAESLGFGRMDKDFRLPADTAAAAAAFELLKSEQVQPSRPYVVMLIGGSELSKRWSPSNFARLADWLLNRYDMPSLLSGAGPAERLAAAEAVLGAGSAAVDLVDKTSLLQMVEILRGSRLVVGNDSGPLHIAAALSVPVVGLYGPTDPLVVGPYGQADGVVEAGRSTRRKGRYSGARAHSIEQITVQAVERVIAKKLEF